MVYRTLLMLLLTCNAAYHSYKLHYNHHKSQTAELTFTYITTTYSPHAVTEL